MSWAKLDANSLIQAADKFEKDIKRLGNKLPGAESMSPFNKLKETITGFKDSLPLIEMLKHPSVQERHWRKIMEETGKDLGDVNLKTMTLSKVFDLELQNFEEKVTEICIEAKEEAKNEENIMKIEQAWKLASFDLMNYRKGAVEEKDKQYVLKTPEDIRQLLEDNILILQSLSASKYVRAIKSRVTEWERDLNQINDCIDTWMIV